MMLIRRLPHQYTYNLLMKYHFHPLSRRHPLVHCCFSLGHHQSSLNQVVDVIVAKHPKEGHKLDLLKGRKRRNAEKIEMRFNVKL